MNLKQRLCGPAPTAAVWLYLKAFSGRRDSTATVRPGEQCGARPVVGRGNLWAVTAVVFPIQERKRERKRERSWGRFSI